MDGWMNDSTDSATIASSNRDRAIQATAEDAVRAKCATVNAGYYDDPFVAAMSAAGTAAAAPVTATTTTATATTWPQPQRGVGRRSTAARDGCGLSSVHPIIKRGTHARVACMDRAIRAFLDVVAETATAATAATTSRVAQVVVLGAGKDTTYFRWRSGLLRKKTLSAAEASSAKIATTATAATAKSQTRNNESATHNINSSSNSNDDNTANNNNNNNNTAAPVTVRWYEVDHAAVLRSKAAAVERHSDDGNCGGIFRRTRILKTRTGYQLVVDGENNNMRHNHGRNNNNNSGDNNNNAAAAAANDNDGNADCNGNSGDCCCYWIAHDLRQDPVQLLAALRDCDRNNNDGGGGGGGWDARQPTLFVAECLFMYLPVTARQELMTALASACPNRNACMCGFEPILDGEGLVGRGGGGGGGSEQQQRRQSSNTGSAFGTMMEQNLSQAGVAAADSCLVQTRTLAQHLDQLGGANWPAAVGCDMWTAYDTVLTMEQRQRANRAEFLDELEEWRLIMKHYCFFAAAATTITAAAAAAAASGATSVGERYCEIGSASPLGFRNGQCQYRKG